MNAFQQIYYGYFVQAIIVRKKRVPQLAESWYLAVLQEELDSKITYYHKGRE